MLSELQNEFDESVKKIGENKLINKLNLQGLKRADLSEEKYEQLLAMEIDIVKNDGKKVGAGIGIGILFSVITGGLF